MRSDEMLSRAKRVIPGGVNSPVRAFGGVGGTPKFIARAEGAYIEDVEGNRYIDLVSSWGAIIHGHAYPPVVEAVTHAVAQGSSYGAPTMAEVELAEMICERVPGMDMVRLVSSGTEATMHAVRLARGVTGRDKLIKMDGCYHGAHDAVLVKAGSGVATFALPGSPGVPDVVAANTVVVPFNDLTSIEAAFQDHPEQIAAVLFEPVCGNMGCVMPKDGYLEGLRALCDQYGALLICDEVMTGFRVGYGGAQGHYGVHADLTCLGKVVGGGFPLAAFGGRAEYMKHLAPVGNVYQAGTLSGNPVAVAAGLAAMGDLTPDSYERLNAIGERLEEMLAPTLAEYGCSMTRLGGMFTIFFRSTEPTCFEEVSACNMTRFSAYFWEALRAGVYLPPSQYEAVFLQLGLTDEDVERVGSVLCQAVASACA